MAIWLGQVMVFLAGAVIGSALDQLHVLAGVLRTESAGAHTVVAQVVWTASLFGVGALALVWPFRLLFRRGAPRWRRRVPATLCLIDFALAYVLTADQKDHPVMVLTVLVATWALIAARSRTTLLYGLGVALFGPLLEATLSALGIFSYLSPGLIPLLRVPIWLPALYLHASLAARGLDMVLFAPHGAPPGAALLRSLSKPPFPRRSSPSSLSSDARVETGVAIKAPAVRVPDATS